MSFIAIVGAGALGGALAQRLASRGRVRALRLIDEQGSVARGKALDIQQSGAVDGFTTTLGAADSIDAAAGAAAIVIADASAGDIEHSGETGLALVRRLASIEQSAPLVFAGASQRQLIARAASELRVPRTRLIGSAPGALESAVRALAALDADGTGVEIQLRVVGVPPDAAVVAWEEATAFGQPISSVLPPHRLAAISARLPKLWPPGPLALASAAARVAEAAAIGSRRRYSCFVGVGEGEMPAAVVAMPVEIGRGGVVRVLRPALTRQEQTLLDNAAASST
jgi:malate dehydrogenase